MRYPPPATFTPARSANCRAASTKYSDGAAAPEFGAVVTGSVRARPAAVADTKPCAAIKPRMRSRRVLTQSGKRAGSYATGDFRSAASVAASASVSVDALFAKQG